MEINVRVDYHFCGEARIRFSGKDWVKAMPPITSPMPVIPIVGDRVSIPGFSEIIFAVKNRCFYFDDPSAPRIELFIDIEMGLEPEKPKLALVKGGEAQNQ